MKNTIKMSLFAAIAVAGLTSTASAKSLEEAIKGTDISGSISYTMEKVGKSTEEAQHDIDIRATLKSTINDTITSTIRFDESNDDDTDNMTTATTLTGDLTGTGTTDSIDVDTTTGSQNSTSVKIEIDRAYFTYANDGLTSSFGLIGAPLTDGGQGDGINVSKSFDTVTAVAGYLYNSGAKKTQDVAFLGAVGSVGAAGYALTYASVMESDADAASKSASFLHANLNTKVAMAKINFDYSSATGDAFTKDQSQMKLSANVPLGAVTLDVAYAENGSNGGETMIDGSEVAKSNIEMGATDLSSATDASAMYIAASTKIANGTATLAYAAISSDTVTEEEKTTKLNYTMPLSSNFKLFANYEDYDLSDKKDEITLGAKYSF